MPLTVSFELSDKDLRHFKAIMREARAKAGDADEADIIAATKELLAHVEASDVPLFVSERLAKIDPMIRMLEDEEWRLEGKDRERVVSALAYFNDPQDLIPDAVPGFGFIDDAIMVQLVLDELQHELEAFEDFCKYRKGQPKGRSAAVVEARAEKLERKRPTLQGRMRRRRKTRARRSASRTTRARAPFSLF